MVPKHEAYLNTVNQNLLGWVLALSMCTKKQAAYGGNVTRPPQTAAKHVAAPLPESYYAAAPSHCIRSPTAHPVWNELD